MAAQSKNYFLDECRSKIAKGLSGALDIEADVAYAGIDLGKKSVDFTVALPRFRLKAKPQELFERIKEHFAQHPDPLVAEITGDNTFAHFMIDHKLLVRFTLDQVFNMTRPSEHHPYGSYGTNISGGNKKVVVEFSSPNIAKPFHAGHLRSTIIGSFLSNLYAANGWDVLKMNYLGDWGVQFGLLAVGFRKYGSEEKLAENAIMHLFDVYVKINSDKANEAKEGSSKTMDEARAIFKAMEDGEPEALALWKRFRDLSIEAYKKVYKRLNISFDDYAGESLISNIHVDNVMKELRERGLLVEKHKWESQIGRDYKASPPKDENGNVLRDENPAWAVDLHKYKLDKPVVMKPDGTTIYMVRDIAGAIQRYGRHKFDKMIYVVGDEQDLHCAQFFKILELMDKPFASSLEHINFGKIKGMSTRKGDVKFLEEILDMSQEAMLNQMQSNEEKFKNVEDPARTSDEIGMTCVKIQDMQAKRINAYAFDLSRMVSFEGDTGAYLQYAHTRLCSVERKVADEISPITNSNQINTDLLMEPKARAIAFLLATYPEVVKMTFKVSEPSTIVSYCFKLAHLISSAWETLIVKGQEKAVAEARLLLFTCARLVLASGMRLLSLTPLDRM